MTSLFKNKFLIFQASLRLYLNLFMCLHLVGFITIFIVPKFLRGVKQQQQQSTKQPVDHHTQKLSNGLQHTTESIIVQNGIGHKTEDDYDCDNNKNNKQNNEQQKLIGIENDAHEPDINKLTKNDVKKSISLTNNFMYSNYNHKDNDDGKDDIDDAQASLSMKIRERIDSETRNLEDFIDKTVTGIVELKDDLMRVNDTNCYLKSTTSVNGINANGNANGTDGLRKRTNSEIFSGKNPEGVDAFLRKELNMAVNQVNVLPAVLSNSHGD